MTWLLKGAAGCSVLQLLLAMKFDSHRAGKAFILAVGFALGRAHRDALACLTGSLVTSGAFLMPDVVQHRALCSAAIADCCESSQERAERDGHFASYRKIRIHYTY